DDPADQVVVAGLLDLDLHHLPGPGRSAVHIDLAVDLRRLSHPAAFEKQGSFLGHALDEDVEHPPDQGSLMGLADLPLDPEELLLPLRLHPRRDLPVQIVRGRSLLAREPEDPDALEAHLLDELAELVELRVGLAGEPDDEARAEDEVGHALAKLVDELAQEGGV